MAKVQDIPKEMDKKPSHNRFTLSTVAAIALLGMSLAYFANLLWCLSLHTRLFCPS